MINISTTAKRLVLRRHSAFDNLHRQPQLLGRTLALMIISSVVAQTSATAGAVTGDRGLAPLLPPYPQARDAGARLNIQDTASSRKKNAPPPVGLGSASVPSGATGTAPPASVPSAARRLERGCGAGRYHSAANIAQCLDCPAGKWQNTSGASTCVACQAGKTSLVTAAVSRAACETCNATCVDALNLACDILPAMALAPGSIYDYN